MAEKKRRWRRVISGQLGRAVLKAALDTDWQADCYKVMLATGSKQEATLRFYEGAGFKHGGKSYFEVRRS